MPEHAAHRDNLTLVMECVGQHMMNHECWSANCKVSIGITKLRIAADLLTREASQICEGPFTGLALQQFGIGDGGTVGWIPVAITQSLKRADPESFAVEYVNHLLAQRRKPEALHFPRVVACRNRRQVIKHEREAGVRPGMEFSNAVNSKHQSPFQNPIEGI